MDNITPVQTVAEGRPSLPAEISILARELRAASFGALTVREAIVRARLILSRKGGR